MRKNWWWFRLTILTLAMVALGWYLFHTTAWRKALGIQADYGAQIAEGDRIVLAIKDFHTRTGLWPEYLEDAYAGTTAFGWFYEVQRLPGDVRVPALSTGAPTEGSRAHLGYVFGSDGAHGDWHVFSGAADRIERAGPPRPACVSGLRSPTLLELDKRIAREPARMEHRQEKISLLVLTDQAAAARAVIEQAGADFPESGWVRLARAALALKEAGAVTALPADVRGYVDWVEGHRTFTRLCGVCWLMRQVHDEAGAEAAAEGAVGQVIEVDGEDAHVAGFYLWDMCRWALATGRWELCVRICDAWEKAYESGGVKDESFWALRGAARVALGEFGGARVDLGRAAKAGQAWAGGAGESVRGLTEAAGRGDAGARFRFPNYPGEWEVFVRPQ